MKTSPQHLPCVHLFVFWSPYKLFRRIPQRFDKPCFLRKDLSGFVQTSRSCSFSLLISVLTQCGLQRLSLPSPRNTSPHAAHTAQSQDSVRAVQDRIGVEVHLKFSNTESCKEGKSKLEVSAPYLRQWLEDSAVRSRHGQKR